MDIEMKYDMTNGLDDVKDDTRITLTVDRNNITHEFSIEKDAMKCSDMLKVLLENDKDCKIFPTGIDNTIPLHVIQYAISFMEYFSTTGKKEPLNIPAPLFTELTTKDPWYTNFIADVAKNKEDLIDLLRLSNFLDISELLKLSAAKMASMLRGRNEQQIREDWNIPA